MITEKFNVVWIFNNKSYSRLCDTMLEAMNIRQRILDAKNWLDTDVSIHLIQINKFGDRIIE